MKYDCIQWLPRLKVGRKEHRGIWYLQKQRRPAQGGGGRPAKEHTGLQARANSQSGDATGTAKGLIAKPSRAWISAHRHPRGHVLERAAEGLLV